jgi:uncharacterized protein
MRLSPLMVLLAVAACSAAQTDSQPAVPRGEVILPNGTAVSVEIADTEPRRQRGLMFRQTLGSTQGMIFVFGEPGDYAFWMQNCLISLDLFWLDADGRIESIAHSLPPCRLPGCPPPCNSYECPSYPPEPGTRASYVLEVVSGFAKQHGLQKGDRLELKGIPRRPADGPGGA